MSVRNQCLPYLPQALMPQIDIATASLHLEVTQMRKYHPETFLGTLCITPCGL